MKRLPMLFIAALAMLPGTARSADAAAIGIFATGVGAPGSVDVNYELVSAPAGVELAAVIIDPTKLAGPWAAPAAGANWIGVTDDDARTSASAMAPSDPGEWDSSDPYVFRTTFDLTGFDPGSLTIQGLWAVDNAGEIFVNGISTGLTTSNYTLGSFQLDTENASFLAGLNTLEFRIVNWESVQRRGNPVGLLVQGLQADARAIPATVPEPGSLLLLGTGLVAGARRVVRRRQSQRTT